MLSDDLLLQDDLLRIWPMVAEANAISEELNKKCKFEITLVAPQARGKDEGRTEVSTDNMMINVSKQDTVLLEPHVWL